ncbi:MAG TPA: hypothetical protein VK798_13930 [Alloacidobacterium sp.]|jgi:hypothetical protein|nr:hypothetical protein [Alloacidobacterium sp.]
MKPDVHEFRRSVFLAVLGILCTTFAGAQLTTSLSGPLDSNLSGLDSNVSPIPTNEIVPGANNVGTPDEHILPYDAIGASLAATPLSPVITQYNAISRVPFQVDVSLRDSTILTGLHLQVPTNVVEVIGRSSARSGSSSSIESKINLTTSGTSPLQGGPALQGGGWTAGGSIIPASSWRVGSMGSATAINSMLPAPTTQPPTSTHLVGEDASSPQTVVKQSNTGDKTTSHLVGEDVSSPQTVVEQSNTGGKSTSQQVDQRQDYSRSPLEKVESSLGENPDATQSSASPFRQLDQGSFLNPDVTLSHPPTSSYHSSSSYQSTSSSQSSTRTQSSILNARKNLMVGNSRNSGNRLNPSISNDEERLMRHTSRDKAKKNKWHNPILQQMEDNADVNQ